VQAFLSECRERVPLEEVQADLEVCATSLETQLVALINEDYADFVRLSSNLVGVDASLGELRAHLQSMLREVQAVRRAVEQSTQAVQQQLFLRRTLRERRQYLCLFLALHEKITRMESHLGLAGKPQSTQALPSQPHTLPQALHTHAPAPAAARASTSQVALLMTNPPGGRRASAGGTEDSTEDEAQLEALLVERVSADYAYVRCRMRQLESTPFVRTLTSVGERGREGGKGRGGGGRGG
jgi:COG2 N-terminal